MNGLFKTIVKYMADKREYTPEQIANAVAYPGRPFEETVKIIDQVEKLRGNPTLIKALRKEET